MKLLNLLILWEFRAEYFDVFDVTSSRSTPIFSLSICQEACFKMAPVKTVHVYSSKSQEAEAKGMTTSSRKAMLGCKVQLKNKQTNKTTRKQKRKASSQKSLPNTYINWMCVVLWLNILHHKICKQCRWC